MPGNVYVFNLYSEPITNLRVAGYFAGSINGYANGSTPPNTPIYTPASLAVPRSKTPGSAASFAIGDNPVVIPWDSFRGTVTVTIPHPATSPISLDDPLILLLAVNGAILLTSRGYLVQNFPVTLSLAGEPGEPEPA